MGLSLFIALTHNSLRMNRDIQKRSPSRYFWWTSIRLDSDPLNRHPKRTTTPCKNGEGNCANWELPPIVWVDPSCLAKFLMLSALPAFVFGTAVVRGLGVSEVWSFAIVMPLLISAWFYFVGWLIDRRVHKQLHSRALTPV
jgi:hypothetical protein